MHNKLTEELKLKIRDEFVHGFTDEQGVRQYPTIKALVNRYEVSSTTLYKYSSDENWQSQKNKVQTEIQEAVDSERVNKMVSDSKRLDDTAIQIAQALLGRVGRKLQKAYQEEANNPDVEAISMQELQSASHVAQNAQKLGKLALGEAQEISKVSANVATTDDFRGILDQIQQINRDRSEKANHTYQ